MRIIIEPILHSQQRYNTAGDWWFEPDEVGGTLIVKVSMTGNDKYDTLVGIHEVVEAVLCKSRGIREVDVSAFDEEFESNRKPGSNDEPGNDPNAPYFKEHQVATQVERIVSDELGVDWDEYDKAIWDLI
jgi:hypothetical protein